jgi:hypothetical protein
MNRLLLLALLALILPPGLLASDSSRIDQRVEAAFRQKSVEATFELTNHSSEQRAIRELFADCPCARVTLEKRELAPGETAVINLQVSLDISPGTQRKTVTVVWNDGETEMRTLTIVVPKWIQVNPRMLVWNIADGASAPKSAKVQLDAGVPDGWTLHWTAPASFEVSGSRGERSRGASYVVTPKAPDTPAQAELVLEAVQGEERVALGWVLLVVR